MKMAIATLLATLLMGISWTSHADISTLLGKEVKIINTNSGKALTVPGMSQENGTELIQYEYLGNIDQKWKIQSIGNGHYKITNVSSNKVVEIADQGLENGDLARQWSYFDVAHHQWKIEPVGADTYRIVNVNSGKVLEVADAGTANHDAIRQWTYFDVGHHQWQISEAGTAQRQDVVVQADSSNTAGGKIYTDGSAQGGSYFDLKADGRVDFNFSVASAGTYSIAISYRSPNSEKYQKLSINNRNLGEQKFVQQSNWTDLDIAVELNAGANTFSIASSWGYMDVDQITVKASGPSNSDAVEAEFATRSGITSIVDDSSASGGQYVQINESGSLTFAINVAEAGHYDINIAYQSPLGDKPQNLYIDDSFQGEVAFAERSDWGEVTQRVYMASGSRKVKLETGWGFIRFDYIKVVPAGSSNPNPALYYDNRGIRFDYQSGEARENFPAPNGGSIRANYSVSNDSGAWIIRTEYIDGTLIQEYEFNMETGYINYKRTNSGRELESDTFAPDAVELGGYISALRGMRPNFELGNAQAYVNSVIALLE